MGTPGGDKLKHFREQRQWSQLDLELNYVIAQKTLSKIETGVTKYPRQDTIERLLAFYEVTFQEAQDVLKEYDYRPSNYPLPQEDDVAAILAQIQPTLHMAPVPAYLVDYLARLHAFNALFLRLSGWDDDKIASMKGKPLWQAHIENRMASGKNMLDPELLEEVGRKRQQLELYVHEPWFAAFIQECGEPFITHWREAVTDTASDSPSMSLAASSWEPVPFTVPNIPHPLNFFFQEETLSDPRFRILYLWPANAEAGAWVSAQRMT